MLWTLFAYSNRQGASTRFEWAFEVKPILWIFSSDWRKLTVLDRLHSVVALNFAQTISILCYGSAVWRFAWRIELRPLRAFPSIKEFSGRYKRLEKRNNTETKVGNCDFQRSHKTLIFCVGYALEQTFSSPPTICVIIKQTPYCELFAIDGCRDLSTLLVIN